MLDARRDRVVVAQRQLPRHHRPGEERVQPPRRDQLGQQMVSDELQRRLCCDHRLGGGPRYRVGVRTLVVAGERRPDVILPHPLTLAAAKVVLEKGCSPRPNCSFAVCPPFACLHDLWHIVLISACRPLLHEERLPLSTIQASIDPFAISKVHVVANRVGTHQRTKK